MGKSHGSFPYSFSKLFLWYTDNTSQLYWTHIFDITLMQNLNITVMPPDLNVICPNFWHSLRICVIAFSFPLHNLHVEDNFSLLWYFIALWYLLLDLKVVQSSAYPVSFFRVSFLSQFQLDSTQNFSVFSERRECNFFLPFHRYQNLCIWWLQLDDPPTSVTILLPQGELLVEPIPHSRIQLFLCYREYYKVLDFLTSQKAFFEWFGTFYSYYTAPISFQFF